MADLCSRCLNTATAISFTLCLPGVAATAQAQATSPVPDAEFIPGGGIGCGQGGRTTYDYRTRAGKVFYLREWRLPAGALVKKALAIELGPGAEVVGRLPVVDKDGNEIAERVTVRFKGGAAVYEASGRRLSVEGALRFEKYLAAAGRWHGAGCRPTTR